jgi:hypothetical protein
MREETRSRHGVAELAARQHGVVSAGQLVELGYSSSGISREVTGGRLHSVHHGVYAVGHAAISRHGESLAAVLSCGEGALLSYRSAAWLWGLTSRFASPVEVTAAGPKETRPLIRVHSAAALTAEDRTAYEGIPVTAIPRTLLDFAAIDPYYLGQALDNARRLGLLDLIAIDELISRSKGFRGVARLRTALELHRPSAFTRSGLERRFLALVRRAGLPHPSMNLFIEGHELDAYWPVQRFAVELDTYNSHGDPRSFETDRVRQENLKLAGIEMIRVTGTRLDREPTLVMRRLHRLLAQRTKDLTTSAR